ncbi:MAG: UMP kinase [Candidatus Paceibacterota bacterium]
MSKKITVISLGGSVIVPDKPNTEAMRAFVELIQARIEEGERFVIVVGGGGVARVYQKALTELSVTDSVALDTIGVSATRLNAELVRIAFGGNAHLRVISNTEDISEWGDTPLIIASGEKPGNSTDYCAVRYAVLSGAQYVLNLSNTSQVYTADPRVDSDAKPLESIFWEEYLSLIPSEWKPGLSTPFDPVASRLAKENNIPVYIMDGREGLNTKNFLEGKKYIGTRIANRNEE